MSWIICLICLLATPALIVCCGAIRQKGLAMNAKWGYNTQLSRTSQKSWDEAQKMSGMRYILFGAAMAIISVMVMLKVPSSNALNAFIFSGTLILTQQLFVILLISSVESTLRARYGKKAA